MFRKLTAFLLAVATAGPAVAGWKEATSTHFILYTQGSADSAKATAIELEKYLYVVRALSGSLKKPDSPLKLRVLMQPDITGVQAMEPYPSGGVAGFWTANARGAVFVGSRNDAGSGAFKLSTRQIMYHELTHHFAQEFFPAAYPVWYQEGLAEYYGSIRVSADNVASLGGLQEGRLRELEGNDWIPADRLLTAHSYGDVGNVSLLYTEGWALVHYLSMTDGRKGQLTAYLTAVNGGVPYRKAATDAFGDLGKLNSELDAYAHRERFQELTLSFKQLDPGPVVVRDLPPAQDALLLLDLHLTTGVPQSEFATFADRVEGIARRYPDDPYTLSILVDTERLAGRSAGEAAAVDHWLKVAPNDGFALAAKARLETDALVAAKSTDEAAWTAVRRRLVQANKAAPDQPRILTGYYDSFSRRGVLSPESAQNALYHAFEVLPQDETLRGRVAADFEARGMIDDAIAIIKPAAYAISEKGVSDKDKARRDVERAKYRLAGETVGETPREMLARLEKKKASKPAT